MSNYLNIIGTVMNKPNCAATAQNIVKHVLNTVRIAGQKHILNEELTQLLLNLVKTTATETSKNFATYLKDREDRYDEDDDLYPVDYERNEVCKLGEVLKSICKEVIS